MAEFYGVRLCDPLAPPRAIGSAYNTG
jgi:hypothetical protein